jgi:hypothetical protein
MSVREAVERLLDGLVMGPNRILITFPVTANVDVGPSVKVLPETEQDVIGIYPPPAICKLHVGIVEPTLTVEGITI